MCLVHFKFDKSYVKCAARVDGIEYKNNYFKSASIDKIMHPKNDSKQRPMIFWQNILFFYANNFNCHQKLIGPIWMKHVN